MAQEEKWVGFGVEMGTNQRVRFEGKSAEDVKIQAAGRAYPVKLHTLGRVEKQEEE